MFLAQYDRDMLFAQDDRNMFLTQYDRDMLLAQGDR